MNRGAATTLMTGDGAWHWLLPHDRLFLRDLLSHFLRNLLNIIESYEIYMAKQR